MKEYTVNRVLNINSGIVGLSDQQYRRRISALKRIGEGVYEVIKPIQFKIGEKIFLNESDNNKLVQTSIRQDFGVNERIAAESNDKHGQNKTAESETDTDDREISDNLSEIDIDDLESLHWKQIKALVEAAGGEWINKQEGIEFLRLNAETNPDGD